MSSEKAYELEQRGIQAARAGQKEQARKLLQHALRLDPISDNAWLWLASVARDKRERLLCLQKVLELNPENEMGIKAVTAMGIDPEQLVPQRQTVADSFVEDDEDADTFGIPIADAATIDALLSQVEAMTEPFMEAKPAGDIEWTRKSRGRTGEREILTLRLQIGAAIAAVVAAIAGAVLLTISSSPELQVTLFGASPTPTDIPPTATLTRTPRPDINPTATLTLAPDVVAAFTETPTIGPNLIGWPLDVNQTPVEQAAEPTPNFADPGDEILLATAVLAVEERRNYDIALEAVRNVQVQNETTFEPYEYYYEALILMDQGDLDEAEVRLSIAQGRNDPNIIASEDARNFQPVIDMGYAQLHLRQITRALEIGDTARADELVTQIEERTTAALTINPDLSEAYIVRSQAYLLVDDYETAISTLNEALAQPQLASDVGLIVARGEARLDLGRNLQDADNIEAANEQFALAQYDGFLGTYTNPFIAASHRLRVESSLALGDLELASIESSKYLIYTEDSSEALTLLAEIRQAENKPDFALDLYTEALGKNPPPPPLIQAEIFLSRAQLYENQRRYDLALADLNNAYDLSPSLTTQFRRMQAAYAAGDLDTAIDDADDLIEAGFAAQDEARIVKARVIVDQATRSQYEDALRLFDEAAQSIPESLRPLVDEYRARILLALDRPDDALGAVNASISGATTGSRRYLRGQIYEANDNRDAAIEEYEWVMTWNTVYDYPFGEDAQANRQAILDTIAQEQANATATAAAATQTVLDATSTREFETTATSAAATQAVIGTFTPTPTPSPTAAPEATAEMTPEMTAEVTPEADDAG